MFKLESYITPVLLNYVGKYVKNFRPEQSQVSLWGGDATFQNLDLRLSTLNEQFHLPFTFISGHIHELLIHVPWVQIISQPIVITINTIECILKLKDGNQTQDHHDVEYTTTAESLQDDTPSGYIQNIITKVVNNITINCNNLILKFVEEDIVLSVNIRFLSMQTVNHQWTPTFTDINPTDMILRKVMTIEDLTLCLDRMDASGKIDIYQDPVIYRCTMKIRWIISNQTNTIQRVSITRFDLLCPQIEFSITQQQIPMLLRLITLFIKSTNRQHNILAHTQLSNNTQDSHKLIHNDNDDDDDHHDNHNNSNISNDGGCASHRDHGGGGGDSDNGNAHDEDRLHDINNTVLNSTSSTINPHTDQQWGSWAWNTLTSIVPLHWSNNPVHHQLTNRIIQTFNFGIYIQNATLTFKTVDNLLQDKFTHQNFKVRYQPFVTVQLYNVIASIIMQPITITQIQIAIDYISLIPRGMCSCSFNKLNSNFNSKPYVFAGTFPTTSHNFLNHSLFDSTSDENTGKISDYYQYITHHLSCYNNHSFNHHLGNSSSSAFVMQYLYCIHLPENITQQQLLRFNGDFQFSNFEQHHIIHYNISNFTITICSGLLHRMSTIIHSIKSHLAEFIGETNHMHINELPPVTVEEFESLNHYIPIKEITLNIINMSINIQIPDHHHHHHHSKNFNIYVSDYPKLFITMDNTHLEMSMPLYPFRVIACASKQQHLPEKMLQHCYKIIKIHLSGFTTQLHLSDLLHMILIMPCDCILSTMILLYPKYWIAHSHITRTNHHFKMDAFTFTTTKSKLLIVYTIFISHFLSTTLKHLESSSLYNDACNEKNPIHLELSFESINYTYLHISQVTSIKFTIASLRIFALDNMTQAFILSAPEPSSTLTTTTSTDSNHDNDEQFLLIHLNYPNDISLLSNNNPSIVIFKISQTRASLDPKILQWINYQSIYYDQLSDTNATEETSSDTSTRRKFQTLHENVHSPSDKQRKRSSLTWIQLQKNQSIVKNYNIFHKILFNCRSWWKHLIFNGNIQSIIIYMPTITMNSLGINSIDETTNFALKQHEDSLKIFTIKTSQITIHSSSWNDQLFLHINNFFKYSSVESAYNSSSSHHPHFPWIINFNNIHCYTMDKNNIHNFFIMQSLNATIDVEIKSHTNTISTHADNSSNTFGICIYIDTSPIQISINKRQIELIIILFNNISTIYHLFTIKSSNNNPTIIDNDPKKHDQYVNMAFSPMQLLSADTTTDTATTTTTTTSSKHNPSIDIDDDDIHNSNITTITSWIQWTITKISIKLFTDNNNININNSQANKQIQYKIIMELEDIITSIDWQSVYLQIKNKITTATIFHYKRFIHENNWILGDYTGLIMSSRDNDIDWFDTKKVIQSDFLNFTITRAKSNNVYTKWQNFKQQKIHKQHLLIDNNSMSMSNYITEIVIRMQILDLLLPMNILYHYNHFFNFYPSINTTNNTTNLSNDNDNLLPLIYLDCKGVTVIIPVSSTLNQYDSCFILETNNIIILPHAKNPICRVILRQDIYQLAAQCNILNTPGSAIEDRQYQINIDNAILYTTTFNDYKVSINKRKTQSLYTMNENPALEWNKLESNGKMQQSSSSICIIPRFNLYCIIAPPIILKSNIIVCGTAIELTLLNEIKVMLNINQIQLLSMLYDQFQHFNIHHHYINTKNQVNTPNILLKNDNNTSTQYNTIILDNLMNDVSVESTRNSTKDSGVDVDMLSSIDVRLHPPHIQSTTTHNKQKIDTPPFEYLINGGEISLILYELSSTTNNYNPLICTTINQFNTYISQINFIKTLRINCFDMTVALFDDEKCKIATSQLQISDFTKFIIKTKNGDPHPNTGIPPSFLEFNWKLNDNDKSQIFIEMARPTKINLESTTLYKLNTIQNKIIKYFINNQCHTNSNMSTMTTIHNWIIKDNKIHAPELKLKTKQIIIAFKSNNNHEIITSLSEFNASICNKPRKFYGNIALTSFTITTLAPTANIDNNCIKSILNPFSCHLIINIIWESWQEVIDIPLIQIQAFSDGMYLNIDPHQIIILENIFNDLITLYDKFIYNDNINKCNNKTSISTEQYYQDDLKTGVFHFADGAPNQVPLPYQVVFYHVPYQIMAWRYPQPRVLTKLILNIDLLLEIIDELANVNLNEVICKIEYWNESLMAYQSYIEFNLTEIDNTTKLSKKFPTRSVAYLWRATITQSDNDNICPILARDLAACIRIDSYFNSSLIPILQVAANIKIIQLSLFNNMNIMMNIYKQNLPVPLDKFKLNDCLPPNMNFINFYMKNIVMNFNRWDCNHITTTTTTMIDFTTNLEIHILDHDTMFMQHLLHPLKANIQITISNELNFLIMCHDMWINFGPEVSHTIAISLDLWQITLGTCDKNIGLLTGIVIANDLNIPIRFGQYNNSHRFLLPSRTCHFYSWCHQRNRQIIIGYENMGIWLWSEPFIMENCDNAKPLKFHVNSINLNDDNSIFITIKSISSNQKIITLSGRIIISNQLNDDFEMKLVKFNIVNDNAIMISGHSTPPSLFVNENCNTMALRLRFANLPNCLWTGDIPLYSNVKCDQPWLVKVPTHEKGQFLSIWVRIIQENSNEHCQILVILSPLYIIQSWLPAAVDIQIKTPTLHTSFITKINGRCKREQIYCPGTIEHFHQIAFQPQSNITTSTMTWIPLSYNFVDQSIYFKRSQKENINTILERLDIQNHITTYPFLDDDMTLWTPVNNNIPTSIQIKYRDAGLESSSLLLEIRPWCFILNSLGISINLITNNGNILCTIPHKGIASPPKIEEFFNIEIETSIGIKFKSSPFQFTQSEWNRGFVMPQINGLIPAEGTIKTCIDCGSNNRIIFIINSTMYEDMRIVKIMSSHVISNFTKYHLEVAPMIVDDQLLNVDIPLDLSLKNECLKKLESYNTQDNIGIPIVQWYNINNEDQRSHYSLFICLSSISTIENKQEKKHWSCPVKVDQSIARHCITISNDTTTIPIIITIQKDRDLTYITILDDINPQFIIENSCPFSIIVGQVNATHDDIQPDAPPFSWKCKIKPGQLCHYTMKTFGNRIPDASINIDTTSSLIITSSLSQQNYSWKEIIHFPPDTTIKFDQFFHIDQYGDIEIIVESRGHTIYIHLEPKSQTEVAVREIRSRLMLEGITTKLPLQNQQISNCNQHNSSMVTNTTFPTLDITTSNLSSTSSENTKNIYIDTFFINVYFHEINLILTQDTNERNNYRRTEVAGIYLTNTIFHAISTSKIFNIKIIIGDLQLDNQMFHCGGFDFPVVLISQKPLANHHKSIVQLLSLETTIGEIKKNSLVSLELCWDIIANKKSCRDVHATIAPINIYIEDRFVSQLLEYITAMIQPTILISPNTYKLSSGNDTTVITKSTFINIPANIIIDAKIMSSPLRVKQLTIDPISILLSVHTSVRLYVALDHSPLHFGAFHRNNLFTTPYRLGNALTMHYLAGAIFGAGWVVGSLEILGSPGSFAQALGVGLKDFIAMPFQGLLQGPWGFIVGITHGSASLMKNITAGTVNSVTKLASSVARNLDRLTLDEEHLQRQEESRRIRPQGVAQGLYQGLSGFGISILAAVGGLAHHPLQHVWSGETTTRGLVTGVGLGLVGVVTKPLSGAAELVALTGQGLLQRTGWNSLPPIRRSSNTIIPDKLINTLNRYTLKLMSYLNNKHDCIIHLINANYVISDNEKIPVVILLTRYNLIIINFVEDKIERIFSLKELNYWNDDHCDNKLTKVVYITTNVEKECNVNLIEQPEMNQELRIRIEQYVLGSSSSTAAGLTVNFSTDNDKIQKIGPIINNSIERPMALLIEPNERNHLIAIMKIIKRQNQGIDFTVL